MKNVKVIHVHVEKQKEQNAKSLAESLDITGQSLNGTTAKLQNGIRERLSNFLVNFVNFESFSFVEHD